MTALDMPAADLAAGDEATPDPVTKALELASTAGFAVLPCTADKRPALGWGVTRATRDPQEIADAFISTGAPLVGVACGLSGLVVVDIDRHPGAADGFASLESSGADMPATWRHPSLSGNGEHAVYAAPAGVELTGARAFPGVDIKAGTGYVVWTGDVPSSRAALAPAPAWTVRPAREASAASWTDGVIAWLEGNDGQPAGDVAATLAAIPPHGQIAEPDLYGYAVRIVRASRWDEGGATAMAALRARYASGQWAAPKYTERVDRAIARAIEAEGAPRIDAPDLALTLQADGTFVRFDPVAEAEALAAQAAAPFRIITRADLRARPKPEWLIDGLLQGSGVLVLAGQGGIGKSFLALDWAAHLATGRRWHGHAVKPSKVLYVAAEGAEFFPDRLDAWEVHNRAFVPDEGLVFVEAGFNLSDPAAVAHMRSTVASEAFDLVVLDTLSQLSAVESENDNAQLAAVMRAARAIREGRSGSSVLIVHHVSKSERGRVRGASAIRDNADTVVVARPDGDGFSLSTRIEHDGKMKNGTAEVLHGFKLSSLEASAVVTRNGPAVDPDGDAIAAVLADGEWHPLADFLGHRGDFSDTTSQRIRRRLGKLVDRGACSVEGATSARRWQAVRNAS